MSGKENLIRRCARNPMATMIGRQFCRYGFHHAGRMDQPLSQRDYYADLGVGADTSGDDLKKAYRKLAMQYHPDRNPGNPKAEDRFKEVNEAYDCLGDSRKRAAYDRMRTPPKPRVTPSGTSGGSRAHPSRPAWQGGSSAGGMPCRTATIRRLRSGTDIVLPISLEDAWAGGLMNVRIDAVVAIPGRVYVPPGVHDGERGIFRSGDGSAPVTFFVQRTRRFDRRSNDLHAVRSLTAERAARGTSLTIRCIDGRKRRATVPPGTRAGTILRLAGMGMPRRNGGGYGDMLIHISVAGPRHG